MADTASKVAQRTGARELSKERHARQLMDAAKEAIYRHGIRGATIDRIQEISGLSRGLINKRFVSKENLLEQTVRAMSVAYIEGWQAAVRAAGPGPAAQLRALIQSDLSDETLNAPNVALWFAFRAEAGARENYLMLISSREGTFLQALNAICDDLSEREGLSAGEGRQAAKALVAMLEGLWTDFHLYPKDFDRAEAFDLCWAVMARFFPRSLEGF